MANYAYLRVSTNQQDLKNQKFEIMEYSQRASLRIDEFVEVEISSRKDLGERKVDYLVGKLVAGDCLIVTELSRIGRSTAEVLNVINALVENGVKLVSLKQNLTIDGVGDMQSKIMVTMFSLFAELERDLISERTRRALEAKKASGIHIGRPKGATSKSKIDGKEEAISDMLTKRISITSIAKLLSVSRGTVYNFISSRKLKAAELR